VAHCYHFHSKLDVQSTKSRLPTITQLNSDVGYDEDTSVAKRGHRHTKQLLKFKWPHYSVLQLPKFC